MSYNLSSSYYEFFSLRANIWKQIDEGTHIHYSTYNMKGDYRTQGSLFNGAIHWFAHRLDLEKNVIIAFDLTERKLLDMNLPDEFGAELHYGGLWVFQEFLSLSGGNYYNGTVEIWVMKEYKQHSSWTKTHVLPTDAIPYRYFCPLTSTKSGDIVGTDLLPGFVKYNDEGQLVGHHSYSIRRYESLVTSI
ncbi:F-box/kelch-repeat protein At3g06240-like [Trifolium pratense]|uniref:F-box/kelch-repeat protein At3g06240-like n=1 Tax=Trifolium pratense TaxID=57577 RepID=UPI001E694357|nr:F-box/kelch-repeat protein At3g06240-like [Trifolium pratense]